ncbi:adenylate/guanylate cyclase domain-containing protein, partial [Promineifilum sp.]|uniref:adenylate/guanylate cyclase domain-containing protein n=1 Tax=Promineifilum sp. TaxID=2664178 RepID=UPI0035AEE942
MSTMICPTCGSPNRAGAAFCRHCGRLLLGACPRCRAAAAPDANFCDACGYPLSPAVWTGLWQVPGSRGQGPGEEQGLGARGQGLGEERSSLAPSPPLPRSPAPPPAGEPTFQLERFIPTPLVAKLNAARAAGAMAGERRVVTLLFCDIQGSTRLAEQLDPEEWTEIVNGAFERMVRPVYKYEGTVARLMGDGLLAFFGAPIAHEDDPRRAVLAGLEIVEGVRAYRAGLAAPADGIDVRVGINTGLVVVGAVGSDLRLEYSALGDAINLAARMEQTAAPGTVRVAEDTYRLVAPHFEVEALGGVEAKGKAMPVMAYRVLRRRPVGDARRALRAPLIDRRREWEQLSDVFGGLAQGRGAILFLTGDAGLGKTRLMDEAIERFAPETGAFGRVYGAAALSYETGQPYGLALRLLRRLLGLMAGDPPDVVRERLAATLGGESDGDDAHRRALATLFGLDDDNAGGEAFAGQLVAAVERLWRAAAAEGPVVLALDDLQWADASSVDLLGRLFGLTESAPLLFLCALRRERGAAGWRLKETAEHDYPHRFEEAALYPLTDGDSRDLLAALLGGADPPEGLRAPILTRAEGNPLFVEEIVSHLIERGQLARDDAGTWSPAAGAAITLPDSLQALLTARIDRLDEETRRVLQIASVLGRNFAQSTLAALVDRPKELGRRLLELQRAELIREVSRLPEPEYAFHHALIHEATYQTILLKERRALHRRAAEAIEALSAGNPAPVAPVLARHYLDGDASARALPHLLLAADSALRLHATVEAITHYDQALPIALGQPDATAQVGHIYTRRGRALELQSNFAAANAAYEELERLAAARGEQALELQALVAQGSLRANVTPLYDPKAARALMGRALELARGLGDEPAEVRILWNLLNIARFDLNTHGEAVTVGEEALRKARALGLREETAFILNDLGDALAGLGELGRAIGLLGESQALWRELGNEPMLANSLTSGAQWIHMTGDLAVARAMLEEAYAISSRIGNTWGMAYSGSLHGVVLAYQGEFGQALDDLTTGLAAATQAGFVGGELLSAAFLANLQGDAGLLDKAVESARRSAELARSHLPQFAPMGLGRLAQALLLSGRTDEAAAVLADELIDLEKEQFLVKVVPVVARVTLHMAQGQPAEAERVAADTIEQVQQHGARLWLVDMLPMRARALVALGRPDEARAALDEALMLARGIGARHTLWQILADRAALEPDETAAAALRAEARAEIDFLAANTWPDHARAAFLARPEVQRALAESASEDADGRAGSSNQSPHPQMRAGAPR